MNSYETAGIATDIASGKRIVVCANGNYASEVLRVVLDRLGKDGVEPTRVLKSKGREYLEVGDGVLTFARTPVALRGMTADKVLMSLEVWASESYLWEWLTNARPVTNTKERIENLSG